MRLISCCVHYVLSMCRLVIMCWIGIDYSLLSLCVDYLLCIQYLWTKCWLRVVWMMCLVFVFVHSVFTMSWLFGVVIMIWLCYDSSWCVDCVVIRLLIMHCVFKYALRIHYLLITYGYLRLIHYVLSMCWVFDMCWQLTDYVSVINYWLTTGLFIPYVLNNCWLCVDYSLICCIYVGYSWFVM